MPAHLRPLRTVRCRQADAPVDAAWELLDALSAEFPEEPGTATREAPYAALPADDGEPAARARRCPRLVRRFG